MQNQKKCSIFNAFNALNALNALLKDSPEILLGGLEEFFDLDSSQCRYFGVDFFDWSGALVALDKEVREWGGAECFNAFRRAECALSER